MHDLFDQKEIGEKMQMVYNKVEKELEMVIKRLDIVDPYIMDLIEFIRAYLSNKKKNNWIRKSYKQIWILIRIIQEYSIQKYLEKEAAYFLQKLDAFASFNEYANDSGTEQLLRFEEKTIFASGFAKKPSQIVGRQSKELQITQVINLKDQMIASANETSDSQKRKRKSSALRKEST